MTSPKRISLVLTTNLGSHAYTCHMGHMTYHMASTSWCSVRYFDRWSRDPVTILTTPPGRSDVSNTYTNRYHSEATPLVGVALPQPLTW